MWFCCFSLLLQQDKQPICLRFSAGQEAPTPNLHLLSTNPLTTPALLVQITNAITAVTSKRARGEKESNSVVNKTAGASGRPVATPLVSGGVSLTSEVIPHGRRDSVLYASGWSVKNSCGGISLLFPAPLSRPVTTALLHVCSGVIVLLSVLRNVISVSLRNF